MIHKEGYRIITGLFAFLVILVACALLFTQSTWLQIPVILASLGLLVFILLFFRSPRRTAPVEGYVYAPADGRVVVVEPTTEKEYFKDDRIQVSIFMSVWNVHVNWYPVAGELAYYQYHPGRYLVARHPKSSSLNERNTLVIRTREGVEILVRQIAGIVARRIISYAVQGKLVNLGDEMGFIRFGSRVDIFLPPGTEILVEPGQRVKGLITPIAKSSI